MGRKKSSGKGIGPITDITKEYPRPKKSSGKGIGPITDITKEYPRPKKSSGDERRGKKRK